MWVDDPGGHYQVSLGCNHSAAAIRSDDNDPRGMSVDPRTGVVTATPQREGAYRDVALVATDGGNNSVVVVVWSFNVTARAADSPWQNVALEASLGCGNFDVHKSLWTTSRRFLAPCHPAQAAHAGACSLLWAHANRITDWVRFIRRYARFTSAGRSAG